MGFVVEDEQDGDGEEKQAGVGPDEDVGERLRLGIEETQKSGQDAGVNEEDGA